MFNIAGNNLIGVWIKTVYIYNGLFQSYDEEKLDS